MNRNHYCVILAGGVGARLWPASRQNKPKQFNDILRTGETLIQATFRRFKQIVLPENILVVSNIQYADLVREQLPELSPSNLLLEPMRRNNMPSAIWASLEVCRRNPTASLIVSPSDQVIKNEEAFTENITHALNYTQHNNRLLVIGAQPNSVNTNYGYIQMADQLEKDIYKVRTFTEKPEEDFARMFVESGEFLWNTGLFAWSADAFLDALPFVLPEQTTLIEEINRRYRIGDNVPEVVQRIFSMLPSLTIEEGVLEKSDNVDVMLSNFDWSDIGTWKAVYDVLDKNAGNGNVVLDSQSLLYDCENCIVKLPQGHVAVLQGLEDYVVVEEGNVLIVCKKDDKTIRKMVNDATLNLGEDFT